MISAELQSAAGLHHEPELLADLVPLLAVGLLLLQRQMLLHLLDTEPDWPWNQ